MVKKHVLAAFALVLAGVVLTLALLYLTLGDEIWAVIAKREGDRSTLAETKGKGSSVESASTPLAGDQFPFGENQDQEGTCTVRGRITFNGKPVEQGTLTFHSEEGDAVTAAIKDGEYTAQGVPVGSHRVTVTAEGLPEKYASKNETPVRFECSQGANQMDIELES
jgi:hypothetical protein